MYHEIANSTLRLLIFCISVLSLIILSIQNLHYFHHHTSKESRISLWRNKKPNFQKPQNQSNSDMHGFIYST